MATTKALKSITMNATKYELANGLQKNDGKIQLMAKDVVLGEVDAGGGEFIITLDDNQYLSTTGYKTCTSFNGKDLADAVKAGKTIKIVGTKIYNEDDNARDTVSLVCDSTDADQGAEVFLTAVYEQQVLTFLAADYDTPVTSINLIDIFPLNVPEPECIIFNITCTANDGDNYPSVTASDYSLASITYEDGTTYPGSYSNLMTDIKSGKFDVKAVVRLTNPSQKYVYPLAMASDRAASYTYNFASTYVYGTDIKMDIIQVYGYNSTLGVSSVLRKTL